MPHKSKGLAVFDILPDPFVDKGPGVPVLKQGKKLFPGYLADKTQLLFNNKGRHGFDVVRFDEFRVLRDLQKVHLKIG